MLPIGAWIGATAADWARRKGLGERAVQHARHYALEAERRLGELLKAEPKNVGARAGGKKSGGSRGTYVVPRDTTPPPSPPLASPSGRAPRRKSLRTSHPVSLPRPGRDR